MTIMIFVVPTHTLDLETITYKPACSIYAKVSKYGDTGTTYDQVFSDLEYNDIKLPIGLALVLSGASGITNAMIVSLPCKTDVQQIKNVINTTSLTPELTQQVDRFYDECFAAAKAKFQQTNPDKSSYEEIMNEYGGVSDLSWLGSHVFQSLYYKNIPPQKPVPGFPYSAFPDTYQAQNEKQGVEPGKWGYPSCEQWWSDPDYGIQHQIVQLVKNHAPNDPHLGKVDMETQLKSWLAKVKTFTGVGSQVSSDDVITRGLLYNIGAQGGFGHNYSGWMNYSGYHPDSGDVGSGFIKYAAGGVAQVGQTAHALMGTIDRAEISQEIPIILAVLLALWLAFGPIILTVGGFRLHVVFTYYFLLTTVITTVFVEKFIHFIELSMHESMSFGLYAMSSNAIMFNVFTKLYFYGPMTYLILLSICGVQLGGSLKESMGNSSVGQGAGFLKGVAKKVASGGA